VVEALNKESVSALTHRILQSKYIELQQSYQHTRQKDEANLYMYVSCNFSMRVKAARGLVTGTLLGVYAAVWHGELWKQPLWSPLKNRNKQ